MPPSMPTDLAEKLTHVIVDCGGEAASALIDLIYAVADPDPTSFRNETAWVVIRKALPSVDDYDSVCESYCQRDKTAQQDKVANVS